MKDINERLKEAAGNGSELMLKSLLCEPGCDASSKDKHSMTALMHAARSGHDGCVKFLLPVSGALTKSKNGLTALMWAIIYGQESCASLLLPVSDAGDKDSGGLTALMWAARMGHEACVRLLLPVSTALDKDRSGLTASCWARKKAHENMAQFIDAYALAQTEKADIGGTLCPGAPRGRAAPRV